MTLKEALNTLKDDDIVSLGSTHGSSYYFIGTVLELKREIEEMTDALSSKMYTEYLTAYSCLVSAATEIVKHEGKDCLDLKTFTEPEDVRVRFNYIQNTNKRFQSARKRLIAFTPLENRTVADIFPSSAEKGNTRIIVDGNEYGTLWTSAEKGV